VIGALGGGLLNAAMRSCTYEIVRGGEVSRDWLETRRPAVHLLWHGRLLPCAYAYRDRGFGTLISRNRDGDLISGVAEKWGYRVVRGSSSRGGVAALKSIVTLLRAGIPVALTPDGPRGPRQKMKIGPIAAARMAGVPIIGASAGATAAWYVGRWDRFLVPKPLAWVPISIAPPLTVDPSATDRELLEYAEHLERELDRLTEEVDDAARSRR